MPLTLNAPLIGIGLGVAGYSADDDQASSPAVVAPPITVSVSIAGYGTGDTTPVEEVPTGGTGEIITLSSPADGEVVATATPQFVVALDGILDPTLTYTIEVQYSASAAFTTPTLLTDDAPVVEGGSIITATSAVPDTTYWRARLRLDGVLILGWTDPVSFVVNTDISPATLPVTWTISASAQRDIHMWHLDPPGPLTDDKVTIYAQGLPASGTVLFGDTALVVESWARIAPSANLNTDARTIDGSTVDPEHYEIVFTAPAATGPGDALSVEA